MSSLSSQLASISQANASLALDRKKKAKLHSASLIFDPKEAATQDFDYIYSIGLDGMDQLSELDTRFRRFRLTLFSETSINIDRNVQTKEQIENLDKTVEVFLSLLGPYLNLTPAVKALEWVLRRFQINIHNPDTFLLISLPYYSHPIFNKILHVIPTLPNLFSWLQGYKKLLKNPTKMSIIKGFSNLDVFKLYSQFIISELKKHNCYKAQLVFYLVNSIQSIASLTNDTSKLNNEYLPILLEVCGNLLNENSSDCTNTAYGIIAVLSAVTSLSNDVIFSIADSMLTNCKNFDYSLQKSTIVVLGKLFQSYDDEISSENANKILSKLDPFFFTSQQAVIEDVVQEGNKINKFLFIYSNILADKLDFRNLNIILKYLKFSEQQYNFFVKKLISLLDSVVDKSEISPIFEVLGKDLDNFKRVLKEVNISIYDLEMKLMIALVKTNIQSEESVIDNIDIKTSQVSVSINWEEEFAKAKTPFMFFNNTGDFKRLSELFIMSLNNNKVNEFFEFSFESLESLVCFLLCVVLSASMPLKVKLLSFKKLKSTLIDVKSSHLYLLIPTIACGLIQGNRLIRQETINCLKLMSTFQASKDSLLLQKEIYGEKLKDAAIIQPKDGSLLLSEILKDIDECLISENQIFRILVRIFDIKKTGKLVLAFFINQWQLIDNDLLKYYFLKFINNTLSEIKGAGLSSELFATFITTYLSRRSGIKKQSIEQNFDFEDFETEVVNLVSGKNKSTGEIDFLINALSTPDIQFVVDKRVTEIFDHFKIENQLKIVNKYIDLLVDDSDIQIDPILSLQTVKFSNELFIKLLADVQLTTSTPEQGIAKRRRRSSTSAKNPLNNKEVSSMASSYLKRSTIILELLDNHSNPSINSDASKISSPELFQSLLKILSQLEMLDLPVIYIQEVLSSCLLSTLKNTSKDEKFDSNTIRADLIVNSIRTCNSPVVQKKLLKVISELATMSTSIVLHSVMPIVTFIGSKSVKQDDAFSEMLMTETLQTVIPVLARAGPNIKDEIEFLLTSFCAAFIHIPRHRRIRLFTTLADTLEPERSLHIILFLIGQQYALASNKHKLAETRSLIEFTSSFVKGFSAQNQISALNGFIELWNLIPTDSADTNELAARPIFGSGIVSLDNSELLSLKTKLIFFIDQTITNNGDELNNLPHLRLKIALLMMDNNSSNDVVESLLNSFSKLLKSVLTVLDNFEKNPDYDSSVIDNLYKLLSDLLNLLPINKFVESVSGLISGIGNAKSDIKIARHMSILVGKKFESEISSNEVAQTTAKKVLPLLVDNIAANKDTELSQTSLISFGTIVGKFGQSLDSTSLISDLKLISSEVGLLNSNPEVIIASLNSITNIVSVVGVKMIGVFPKVLPPSIDIWQKYNTVSDVNDSKKLIQTSILILISNLVKRIPAFMISSLDKVFKIIYRSDSVDEVIKSSIIDIIIHHMELKSVMKSLSNIWSEDVKDLDPSTIGLYLHTVELTIEKIDKKSASTQASSFINFLLSAFEFRSYSKLDTNSIHRIEASLFNCSINYIMKLNDKTFRPLFAVMVRWAFDGEGSSDISESERLLVFFKFYNKLQESLKSVVTTYYTYLIESSGKILNRFIDGNLVDINLRRILISSLTSSFKYDQDDYWQQQARFDIIAPALINQLSNIEDGIGKYLVKSVSALSQNSTSEEQKKKLNEHLLAHMKANCSSREKLWAVKCLKMIYQKVGESWVNLLPQLVPIIAELLEDDNEDVEYEVRSGLVKVIESVLGEPLDRYLD